MQSRAAFGLHNFEDWLDKLDWEIENLGHYEADEIRGRYCACNCALTVWHATDWLYHFLPPDKVAQITASPKAKVTLKQFQDALRKWEPKFEWCWAVANGTKHFDFPKPEYVASAFTSYPPTMTGWGEEILGPVFRGAYFVVHGEPYPAIDVFRDLRDALARLV
jgi:hypothetical protein